jgi:hypothetical protein
LQPIIASWSRYKVLGMKKMFAISAASHLLLVDSETEEVLTVIKDHRQADYLVPCWDTTLLIRQTVGKAGRTMEFVTIDTKIPIKDVYLGMLLHIKEDFDDDLLFEAIQLLE